MVPKKLGKYTKDHGEYTFGKKISPYYLEIISIFSTINEIRSIKSFFGFKIQFWRGKGKN